VKVPDCVYVPDGVYEPEFSLSEDSSVPLWYEDESVLELARVLLLTSWVLARDGEECDVYVYESWESPSMDAESVPRCDNVEGTMCVPEVPECTTVSSVSSPVVVRVSAPVIVKDVDE
jgi:hypothetical protein